MLTSTFQSVSCFKRVIKIQQGAHTASEVVKAACCLIPTQHTLEFLPSRSWLLSAPSYHAAFFQSHCLCEPAFLHPASSVAFSSSAIKINRMSGDNLPDSQAGFLTLHITQSFLTGLVTLGGPVLGTQVSLSFALGSIRDASDPSLLLVGQTWVGLRLLTRL